MYPWGIAAARSAIVRGDVPGREPLAPAPLEALSMVGGDSERGPLRRAMIIRQRLAERLGIERVLQGGLGCGTCRSLSTAWPGLHECLSIIYDSAPVSGPDRPCFGVPFARRFEVPTYRADQSSRRASSVSARCQTVVCADELSPPRAHRRRPCAVAIPLTGRATPNSHPGGSDDGNSACDVQGEASSW